MKEMKEAFVVKEHEYLLFFPEDDKNQKQHKKTQQKQHIITVGKDEVKKLHINNNKLYLVENEKADYSSKTPEIQCIDGTIDFENREYDLREKVYYYCVNPNAIEKEKKAFLLQEKIPILEKNEEGENKKIVCKDIYKASYLIGAQWIREYGKRGEKKGQINKTYAVVVSPKFMNIDYSDMFMTCLRSGIESESFSKLYSIDFESKDGLIYAPSVVAALNPLLISHFLTLVENLLKKGLKKGYVYRNDNLKKPKGRIDIRKNERKNIIQKRYDRVYCNYTEYSVDIPENRIIKKALIFVKKMLSLDNNCSSVHMLMLRKALNAFYEVSDQINVSEIKQVKSNKLFKDYPETIRLAKMILKRYGYSISNVSQKSKEVPPFWIDMAGLFEHYVLVKLKQKYGDRVLYQRDKGVDGNEFKFAWRPDFLLKVGENSSEDIPMIIDSKYKYDTAKENDIRQLSGYAREMGILRELGVKDEDNSNIPCVLIYPYIPNKSEINKAQSHDKTFDKIRLTKTEIIGCEVEGFKDFYKILMEVPLLKFDT